MSGKPLRVVLVTLVDLEGPSGQNVFSRELAVALARRPGIELWIVCPAPTPGMGDGLDSLRAHFEYLPPKVDRSVGWQLRVQPALARAVRRVHRSAGGLDLLVTTVRPGLALLPAYCVDLNVAQITFKEGSWDRSTRHVSRLPGFRMAGRLAEWVNARASERVLALSHKARDELAAMPGISPGRVEFIHHPVRADAFPPRSREQARRELGLDLANSCFTIGFVGSFKWYHCVPNLLRAAALLDDPDVHVLLVGEGPELETAKHLSSELGLGRRVTFVGHVAHEHVGAYMSASDVLFGVIHPGREDNPMKVYEYLASGRPVLAYRTPELEFVEEIGAGHLVQDISPKALARALYDMKSTPLEFPDRTGTGAPARVRSVQTWDGLAQELLEASRDAVPTLPPETGVNS